MFVLFPWTTQQMTAALSASHQDVLKSVLTSGYINMPWARIFLRSLALTKSFWYVPASVLRVMTCFLCWSPDSHVRAINLRLCSDTCSPNGYLCSWSLTQKSEKFNPACLMLCRLCWKVTLNRAREPEAGRPWNLCGAPQGRYDFSSSMAFPSWVLSLWPKQLTSSWPSVFSGSPSADGYCSLTSGPGRHSGVCAL